MADWILSCGDSIGVISMMFVLWSKVVSETEVLARLLV